MQFKLKPSPLNRSLWAKTLAWVTELLDDLAALDSDSAQRRRLKRDAAPGLLLVDEVGYLSYSARGVSQRSLCDVAD